MPGANVFLASTTYGTATDRQGDFRITQVRPGSYMLVVSMIGYASYREPIQISESGGIDNLNVRMERSLYEIEGIEVTAERDRTWQRHFERFKELFLGESERAEGTVLLNFEVLEFEEDAAGRLTATASSPLELQNNVLGYTITYVLHEFSLDPHSGILRYQGEPLFTPISPRSEVEREVWQTQRKEAYLGSLAHLFSSLIDGSTFEEGFQLYEGKEEIPVGSDELLTSSYVDFQKELSFENPLKVVYQRSKEEKKRKRFRFLRNSIAEEVSYLTLHSNSVSIERDGYYFPSNALTITGVLGQRRIADMVPRNFDEPETPIESADSLLAAEAPPLPDTSPDSLSEIDRTEEVHDTWITLYTSIQNKHWSRLDSLYLLEASETARFVNLFRLIDQQLSERSDPEVYEWLVEQSPDFGLYYQAEELRRQGELEQAKQGLIALLQQPIDIPLQPILLSLARLYVETGDVHRGQGAVYQALAHIEYPFEAALVFEDFKYILTDQELETYEALVDPEALTSFLETLWIKRNPFPGRPDNPRLTEHYRRLLYAEQYYLHYRQRTWRTDPDRTGALILPAVYELNHKFNDKGLIYIRHGEPDDRIVTTRGEMDPRTATFEAENYPNESTSVGNRSDELTYLMRETWMPYEVSLDQAWEPNESWRYFNPDFEVHFVAKGGGSNWRLSPELPRFRELYEDREHWGGIYAEMALNAQAYESALESDLTASLETGGAPRMRGVIQDALDLSNRFIEQTVEDTETGLTNDRHTWPEDVELFPVYALPTSFRGEPGRTDLVVYYAFPTRDLIASEADSLQLEMGFAVHDTTWQPVHQTEQAISVSGATTGNAVVSTFELSAQPAYYHVSVFASPEASMLEGGYASDIWLPDYDEYKLMISDIVLASDIQIKPGAIPDARDALEIIPNPTATYYTSSPIRLYFEVYNLAYSESDETSYSMQIRLNTLKRRIGGLRRRTSLTVEANQSSSSIHTVEFPEIDISAVAPGTYELVVEVTDLVSGSVTSKSRIVYLRDE